MSYRIEWLPTARKRFSAEFERLDKGKQRLVVDALADIDFQLTNLPLESGESRESITNRILPRPPVIVIYRVTPRLRLVEIIAANAAWRMD